MAFDRGCFVLRGEPSRSVHSPETSFSFTPGTTVRFCWGLGGLLPPRPAQEARVPGAQAAPAAPGPQQHSPDGGPTCTRLFSEIWEQAALSPSCQGEGPRLPASPQIAEQVSYSLVPPECPLHEANKFTHTHCPSPGPRKGPFNGRSVILRKRPSSVPTAKIRASLLGGWVSPQGRALPRLSPE